MDIPVYVSLTSIFQNQDILVPTLVSMLKQTVKPNKIFLHLSEEEYLLDSGFPDKRITDERLVNLLKSNSLIEIRWVKNIGPYRKLLPLLKEKWNENCIIITIDDDTCYTTDLIEKMLEAHKSNNNCIIGSRGFTPRLRYDDFKNFDYYERQQEQSLSLYNFLTGKGGIFYKPSFFHKTGDLIFNEEIFQMTIPKQDDIWFYVVRILNNVQCYIDNKPWYEKDNSRAGLFVHFNSKNNANTDGFKKLYNVLKDRYSFNI